MNVLVTVGTTSFDKLIEKLDLVASKSDCFFTFQYANGSYIPSSGESFTFIDNIEEIYKKSDLIITHAGAGTIYRLLEMNKKIIVVPNLERVDKHQIDIASFMESNKHVLVAWNIDELGSLIERATLFEPNVYNKEAFFKADEIVSYLLG